MKRYFILAKHHGIAAGYQIGYSGRMEKIVMSGSELQEIRKKQIRIKQEEFGAVVGADRTTVSDWERGNAKVPHYAALVARIMADDPMLREKILRMVGLCACS